MNDINFIVYNIITIWHNKRFELIGRTAMKGTNRIQNSNNESFILLNVCLTLNYWIIIWFSLEFTRTNWHLAFYIYFCIFFVIHYGGSVGTTPKTNF